MTQANKAVQRRGLVLPVSALKKIVTTAAFLETYIPSAAVFIVAVMIMIEAIARFGFSYGIFGLEQVAIIIGLYGNKLGSACASRDNVQIKVTLIRSLPLSPKVRRAINSFGEFITAVGCAGFTWVAYQYCAFTLERGVMIEPLGWSMFVLGFVLVSSYGLMGVHHFTHSITVWRKLGNDTH